MNIRKEILLLLLFIFSFTGFSQVTVIRKIDSESWFSMEIRTEVINKIFRAALASKLTVFKKEDLKEKMEAGEILDISVRKVMISINRTAEEPYPGHDTLVNVYKDRIEWLRDIVVCEKFCFVNKTDQYNVKYLSMGLSAFFDWGNKDIYWFKISDVQKLLGDFLFKSLLNAIETDTRFIYQEKENNSFSDRQVDLSKYLGIKLMNNFNNDILYYANIQLFPIYTNMNLNSFTSEKEYLAKCNVRTFDNSDFQTTYITEYQGDSLIQRIEEIEIESEFIPPFREDSFKAYKLSEKILYRKDQLGYSCKFRAMAISFMNYHACEPFLDELFWVSFDDLKKHFDENEIHAFMYFFMLKTTDECTAQFWINF